MVFMLFNPEQPHDGMAHDKTGIDYVMVYIKPKLFLEILEEKDIVRFSSPIVYNYSLQTKNTQPFLCNTQRKR